MLTGRDSKKFLKIGDFCRARIIAVSFKDVTNPKIGLTMRQPGLGKIEWLNEDKDESVVIAKAADTGKDKKTAKNKEKKK